MEKAVAIGEDKPIDFDPSIMVDEVAKLQTQINSLHLQSIGNGKNASNFDSTTKKYEHALVVVLTLFKVM